MAVGIHGEGLGCLAGSEAANFADQLPAVPLRLALDLRVVVLDLLAVGRQPRRAAVGRGDDDHRLGLRDREVIRRSGEVAHRVAHARHGFAIHVPATAHAAAAEAAATASESATTARAACAAPSPAVVSWLAAL